MISKNLSYFQMKIYINTQLVLKINYLYFGHIDVKMLMQ